MHDLLHGFLPGSMTPEQEELMAISLQRQHQQGFKEEEALAGLPLRQQKEQQQLTANTPSTKIILGCEEQAARDLAVQENADEDVHPPFSHKNDA